MSAANRDLPKSATALLAALANAPDRAMPNVRDATGNANLLIAAAA